MVPTDVNTVVIRALVVGLSGLRRLDEVICTILNDFTLICALASGRVGLVQFKGIMS